MGLRDFLFARKQARPAQDTFQLQREPSSSRSRSDLDRIADQAIEAKDSYWESSDVVKGYFLNAAFDHKTTLRELVLHGVHWRKGEKEPVFKDPGSPYRILKLAYVDAIDLEEEELISCKIVAPTVEELRSHPAFEESRLYSSKTKKKETGGQTMFIASINLPRAKQSVQAAIFLTHSNIWTRRCVLGDLHCEYEAASQAPGFSAQTWLDRKRSLLLNHQ